KQRGVDTAKDHPRAALTREPADLVPAPRVAGVNSNPDHIATRDRRDVDPLERFIDDARIAPFGAGGCGEDVQPARCNHRNAKRYVTRIDQMDATVHEHLVCDADPEP